METFYIKGSCRNEWISNIWDVYPISITVIKFVGGANPITNFEFAEEYVKNNK